MIKKFQIIVFFSFIFQLLNVVYSGEPTPQQNASDNFISQSILKATWKPINDITIKLLSEKVDQFIKDPEAYLKNNFKSTIQFKDFNSLKKSITKNASEIKKVQTKIVDGNLQITYQSNLITISTVGLGTHAYVINNQLVTWNPRKDALKTLEKRIEKLVEKPSKAGFNFSLISNAIAETELTIPAYEIFATILSASDADSIVILCDKSSMKTEIGEQINAGTPYTLYAALDRATNLVNKAKNQCDNDFTDLQTKAPPNNNSETIQFLSYLRQYLTASNLFSSIIGCHHSRLTTTNCQLEMEEFCKQLSLLEKCLNATEKLQSQNSSNGPNVSDTNKRYDFKPSDNSGYKPLMDAFSGNKVQSK